jgi:hypothetical protein
MWIVGKLKPSKTLINPDFRDRIGCFSSRPRPTAG